MDAALSPLASWGIPGFFILVLSGVVVKLYTANNRLNDKIQEIQMARVTEAKEARDTVVAPLELLGRQNQLILDKLNGK